MDSLESNKIFAAILLAGLIAMFSGFIAELVFHEEKLEEQAYKIDTSILGVTAETEEEVVAPLSVRLADADVGEGEKLARACIACHSFEQGGPTKIGPNLWDIVNADKAHVDDFAYSRALAEMEGVWTYEALEAFLHQPREYVPGTKMSYAGMRDPEDRADIIAYLRSLSAEPAPLPPVPEEAVPDEAAE